MPLLRLRAHQRPTLHHHQALEQASSALHCRSSGSRKATRNFCKPQKWTVHVSMGMRLVRVMGMPMCLPASVRVEGMGPRLRVSMCTCSPRLNPTPPAHQGPRTFPPPSSGHCSPGAPGACKASGPKVLPEKESTFHTWATARAHSNFIHGEW